MSILRGVNVESDVAQCHAACQRSSEITRSDRDSQHENENGGVLVRHNGAIRLRRTPMVSSRRSDATRPAAHGPQGPGCRRGSHRELPRQDGVHLYRVRGSVGRLEDSMTLAIAHMERARRDRRRSKTPAALQSGGRRAGVCANSNLIAATQSPFSMVMRRPRTSSRVADGEMTAPDCRHTCLGEVRLLISGSREEMVVIRITGCGLAAVSMAEHPSSKTNPKKGGNRSCQVAP